MLLTLETPAAQKKILEAIGSDEGKKKVGELLQLATGTIASSLAGDDARKQVITMLAHPDTRAAVASLLTERVLLDALAGAITDSAVQAQLLTFLVSMSLPIVTGLIHFASTHAQLDDAIRWVKTEWPDVGNVADPIPTLAALVLIHIVEQGLATHANDPDRTENWMEMKKHVEKQKPRA